MQTVTIGDETVKQETLVPLDGQSNPVTLYGGTVTIYDDGSADVVETSVTSKIDSNTTLRGDLTSFYFTPTPTMRAYRDNTVARCSHFKRAATSQDKGIIFGLSGTSNIYIYKIANIIPSLTTMAEVKQWLINNNVQFYYQLATPTTYHFTNLEELKVWLGENNFWCDISDDISVKYWNRGFGN